MEQKIITISDARLREAAAQGMDEFLQVFIDRYREVIGGELNAGNMGMLNGEQISLLAYALFREEVMDGGFIQLIHNGYGPFIFDNPFAKAMRLMGAHDFSKLVYKGKRLYDKYKEELTKDWTKSLWLCSRRIRSLTTWMTSLWKWKKKSRLHWLVMWMNISSCLPRW